MPYPLDTQVSYGSTSPTLSKKQKYPLFFRTIPSDAACNKARVALLRKFNWLKVGLIGQNDIINSEVRQFLLAPARNGANGKLGKAKTIQKFCSWYKQKSDPQGAAKGLSDILAILLLQIRGNTKIEAVCFVTKKRKVVNDDVIHVSNLQKIINRNQSKNVLDSADHIISVTHF